MGEEDNYRIAIVGDKNAILGFKALGLKTHNANTAEEAVKILYSLKAKKFTNKAGETQTTYAIIFITEDLAMNISKDDYKKLSQSALPAIIPVPGTKGTTGYGIKRIGKMVEQAVGSDIFKE